MVGAARGGDRALRAGRARAPRLADGLRRRRAVARQGGHAAGSAASRAGRREGSGAFVLETHRRRAARAAARRPRGEPRRRSRSEAARERSTTLPGARLDQRATRCVQRLLVGDTPAPGDARLLPERRRAALQARGQLGPGHDPRLPRAAGRRRAQPHAADRPVPARAARALPARPSRSTSPPNALVALQDLRREHASRGRGGAPLARAGRARRWTASRASAASCARSSAPASATRSRRGARFIADEQGLGKTVEALAALEEDDAYPAVVVCPASLKLNWQRETARWLPHRDGRRVLSGTASPRATTPTSRSSTTRSSTPTPPGSALRRPEGARARRVALRQEPARQAHAGRAQARRRAAPRTRCASR